MDAERDQDFTETGHLATVHSQARDGRPPHGGDPYDAEKVFGPEKVVAPNLIARME